MTKLQADRPMNGAYGRSHGSDVTGKVPALQQYPERWPCSHLHRIYKSYHLETLESPTKCIML
jgi:hypothetical protein